MDGLSTLLMKEDHDANFVESRADRQILVADHWLPAASAFVQRGCGYINGWAVSASASWILANQGGNVRHGARRWCARL